MAPEDARPASRSTRLRAGRMVSPMITAARPITMVPMPIEISDAALGLREQRAGQRHQRVGQRHAAQGQRGRCSHPAPRAMRPLAPVARSARPRCVAEEPVQRQTFATMTPTTSSTSGRGEVVGQPLGLKHA